MLMKRRIEYPMLIAKTGRNGIASNPLVKSQLDKKVSKVQINGMPAPLKNSASRVSAKAEPATFTHFSMKRASLPAVHARRNSF